MRTKLIAFITIAALGPLGAADAFAQSEDPVAAAYARAYGLQYTEAFRRLSLIDNAAISELQQTLSSRPGFAGLKVEHGSEPKLVVMAKDNAQEIVSGLRTSLPISTKNVPQSFSDLSGAAKAAAKVLQNLRVAYEYEIDPESGAVNFYIVDDARARPALQAVIKNFPFVNISKVESLSKIAATFIGGQQVTGSRGCTSGFTVFNASNTAQRGVVTAAHCGTSNVRINGVTFSSPVRRLYGGDNDQMWFTASGHSWTNTIYIGQTSPSTISIKGTFDPPVGQVLCKYGLTTGQTCGEVMSKTVSVFNPDAPAGQETGIYYRVRNFTANQPMTQAGDSGGPVFGTEGAAFGLIQSQGGSQFPYDMYFMPAIRFQNLGVSVLTTP